MKYLAYAVDALKEFAALKKRLRALNKTDPIMTRLNLMALQQIFESLPRVPRSRIALGAFVSLTFRVARLPFALFRSWWKWGLLIAAIFVSHGFAPDLFQRYGVFIVVMLFMVVFRVAIFHGLPRGVFLVAEMMTDGRLMTTVGTSYLAGSELAQRLLNPWGPIFNLLPIYAEMLNGPDADRYQHLMNVFLRYTETHDTSDFIAMEKDFWAARGK